MKIIASQANLIEEKQFVGMIIEISLVGGSHGWIGPLHTYYDCVMFKIYTSVKDKNILLGDTHTTYVIGIGDVDLDFTSKSTLIIKDVCILQRLRILFLEKEYVIDDMIKLNVDMNKISNSVYVLCFLYLVC